jgi:hypothetical protein
MQLYSLLPLWEKVADPELVEEEVGRGVLQLGPSFCGQHPSSVSASPRHLLPRGEGGYLAKGGNRKSPSAAPSKIILRLFNRLFDWRSFSPPILFPLSGLRLISPCPSRGNAVRDGASWRWDGSPKLRRRALWRGRGTTVKGSFIEAGPCGNAADPAKAIAGHCPTAIREAPGERSGPHLQDGVDKRRSAGTGSDRQAHKPADKPTVPGNRPA